MTDSRLKRAWRDWVVEESPEAAQRYCVELARSEQAPTPATILSHGIDWTAIPRHDAAQAAVYKAARVYLSMEPDEVCLEELAWVSEEHYFLLGDVNPSVMRTIAKVYETHGLELKAGDEDEAQEDYDRAQNKTSRSGAAKIRELERELSELERELGSLKVELDNVKRIRDFYQGESKRAKANLELHKGDRKKQLDFDGLQASYDILMKENVRLTKLLREATSGD